MKRVFVWVVPALAGLAAVLVLVAALPMMTVTPPTPVASPAASASPSATATTGITPGVTPVASPTPDNSRYPDGIPTTLRDQPVYVGWGAVVHADATTDATPFLVGGWFGDGTQNVCTGGGITLGSPDPALFHRGCGSTVGGRPLAWNGHSLPGGLGPSIVRVHANDPLSAQCGALSRVYCAQMLIVDAVLWTSDAVTSASPISVAQAFRDLDTIVIENLLKTAKGSEAFLGRLFLTIRPQPCRSPWPAEVFDIRGDPRFALMAMFPNEAARVAAQPLLDSAADACPVDPRVVRPGGRTWVAKSNVLVLVYGSDAASAVTAALSMPSSRLMGYSATIGFPDPNLDRSYGLLVDSLAGRVAGDLASPLDIVTTIQGSNSHGYVADAKRRYLANALSFTIGPPRPVNETDAGAAAWTRITQYGIPDTARLYEVDHPATTDPALRRELYVAFRLKDTRAGSWGLILVDAEPWPAASVTPAG